MFVSDTGTVNFDQFCKVAGHFLENEDDETVQRELKEAFRLYDKEGKHIFKYWKKWKSWYKKGKVTFLLFYIN